MQFFLFVIVVILILIGIITIQNPGVVVTVEFIKWSFTGSIAAVLAVPFAIGIIAGLIIFLPPLLKKASLARSQKKRIKELETEVANLSEQPDEEEEETGEEPKTVEDHS